MVKPPNPSDYPAGYSWVYVLAAGPFCKVGRATDVGARLKACQTGCPYEITFAYAQTVPMMDVSLLEGETHRQLSPRRARGEWFTASAEEAIEAISLARAALNIPDYNIPISDLPLIPDRMVRAYLSRSRQSPAALWRYDQMILAQGRT